MVTIRTLALALVTLEPSFPSHPWSASDGARWGYRGEGPRRDANFPALAGRWILADSTLVSVRIGRYLVVVFTLRLPDSLEERLEDYCSLTAATKTGVVVLAVQDFLDRHQGVRARPVAQMAGGKRYSGPDPK